MRKYKVLLFLLFLMLTGGYLQAQTIAMRIPDTTVVSGSTIDLPVYADNTLTGNNVISYSLQLTFNQASLQALSVITAGTISSAFGSPYVNTSVAGTITIAAAGTAPLAGAGKFIYIRFKALQPYYTYVSFSGSQYNYFNEGTPAMTFHNGTINVTSPPTITVYPNNGLMERENKLKSRPNGGTKPYNNLERNPAEVPSILKDIFQDLTRAFQRFGQKTANE